METGEDITEEWLLHEISERVPEGFPVRLFQNVAPTGNQNEGEVDLLFASDSIETAYLVLECKTLDGTGRNVREKRRLHRKHVQEQACRNTRLVCQLFQRPALAAVYTSEDFLRIRVIGGFLPTGKDRGQRCQQHDAALWLPEATCSLRYRCRGEGCSKRYPCRKSSYICSHGCEVTRFRMTGTVAIDAATEYDDPRVGTMLRMVEDLSRT